MEKSIRELEGCERELEIFLSTEELQPYYNKAYFEAQSKIDIKGFRRGKVPVSIIKQRFGKQLELEALETVADETFNSLIQKKEINFIGQPKFKDFKEEANGVKLYFVYEIFPEFELADFRGLNIDEPIHRVTDDEIEHEIHHVCINNGKLEPADIIVDDMFVVNVTLREIDEITELPILGGIPKTVDVFLHDHSVLPELRVRMVNMVVGDSFIFNPRESDEHSPDKKHNITVNNIQRLVPAELTDEFIGEYTNGKFSTVDDFKQELGFQLQENWDQQSRQEMEKQIRVKLLEMHNFELPSSVVFQTMESLFKDFKKNFKNEMEAQAITMEAMKDDLRKLAEPMVKWEIIKDTIIEKEGIKVEDFDIEDLVESEANRLKTDKKSVEKAIRQNKNIQNQILTKKLFDLILDFAVTTETSFGEGEETHNHEHDDEEEEDDDDFSFDDLINEEDES